MKYSVKFLAEVKRFDECNRQPGSPAPTEIGLKQFFEWESKGIEPAVPDRYFKHLLDGKKWWEWTLSEIAKTYLTSEWFGWMCYAEDFKDDQAGFRQLRQRCGCEPCSPQEFFADLTLNPW